MRIWHHPVTFNLAVLLFGALPLAIFGVFLWFSIFPPASAAAEPWRFDLGRFLGGGLFYWLVYALPVLAGGGVHQAALALIPPTWSRGAQRLVALASTPLVLLGAFVASGAVPMDARLLGRVAAIAAVPLACYGLAVRMVRQPHEAQHQDGRGAVDLNAPAT